MKRKIKNIKPNIFLALLSIIFSLCTSGCSYDYKAQNDAFSIVTVNYVQYDFARAVCGNDENITMIMKPGAEIHGFEPSLADIEAISNADVFIYNGGESDTWVENILDSIEAKNLKTVVMMNHAILLEEEHSDHSHAHSRNHEEHNHENENGVCPTKLGYDEHIWTSPKNAKCMINAICDALCKANPQNADLYKKNSAEYISKIDEIHHELKAVRSSSKTNFIAVGDKFPFLYLANEYDLDYMAAFPGCSHENDASPSVIMDIIKTVKSKNIKYVFYTESSDGKMADTICEETGAKKLLLHSAQTISPEDFKAGKTYAELMEQNTRNLKEALS